MELVEICDELRRLSRSRAINLRSRIMLENRLVAVIANYLGYDSLLSEKERMAARKDAASLIARVVDGEKHELEALIKSSLLGSDGFDHQVDTLEKAMVKLVLQLPSNITEWLNAPEQRGFGAKSLALIIGETGDLSNYASPGKVWRRMGCAPFESKGLMRMGATWKSGREGKLSSAEWEEFGYSPRRRSVMYVIGESLMKGNTGGPYKLRYDQAKERAKERHPEWVACVCEGTGKTQKGTKCSGCLGKGYKMLRCHYHGQLLMTKLLLKNLWMKWNPELAAEYRNPYLSAVA